MPSKRNNLTGDIVYFLRDYADIDHITPVISHMADTRPSLDITVIIANVFVDFRPDYRLQYLKGKGVKLLHLLDICGIEETRQKTFFRLGTIRPFRQIAPKFMEKYGIYQPNSKNFAEKFWMRFGSNLRAVLFDHKGKYYKHFTDLARENNVLSVSLPHAADNFDNFLSTDHQVSPKLLERDDEQIETDLIFVPSEITKEHFIARGHDGGPQLRVLGCPRFSERWMAQLDEFIPRKHSLPETDNYKILFFLPKAIKNTNIGEIYRIIEFISNFEDVTLVVQSHIRRGKLTNGIKKNVVVADPEITSKELIDWADLTLFTATSVVFDNIVQDKPVLHLRRTMNNKLALERHIRSWSVDCRDELYARIQDLRQNKKARAYTKKERSDCIKNLVEPAGKDVQEIYVKTILDNLKN